MKKQKNEFPHPVLVNNGSDYIDCSFDLKINDLKIEGNYLKAEVEYSLNSPGLTNLLNENKLKVLIKIQSPKTAYRNIFEIENNSNKIAFSIPENNIADKIEISGIIVAAETLEHFSLEEHNKAFFNSANFEIRKGDILAIHPGFEQKIDSSEMEGPVASIFNISRQDINVAIKPDFSDHKIEINLNNQTYESYFELKNKKDQLKKYLSAVVVFPVLVEALGYMQGVKTDKETLYDEYTDKRWYRVIENKIQEKNIDLQNLTLTEAANNILGDIVQNSLISLKETINDLDNGEFESGGND